MSEKKRSSHGTVKALFNLLLLIPTILNVINHYTRLLKYEACLAGKSIIVIITLAVMFACLLTATWLSALALLFFVCLVKLQWSWIAAAIIVLLLNLLLLLILSIAMSRAKNHLSFPETRRQLCKHQD